MPGFVDQAQLHARAGDGGAGAVSWRREAHVDRGGPDGGDGGHGGDVWLAASLNQSSLLGFRDHPFRRATDGTHGSGSKRHGARGKDLVVPVPVGTVVRHRDGAVVCDLTTEGARFMVAEGGQGGRGNARFLSNRRRAPAFAEQGEKGQEFWLDMELKLMADVALVGFPNAGKSTLISTVSAAKPKIADYPFTTLEPHLGVVRLGSVRDGTEFVMADIPGLVEGAAEGKGLGHQFLRHIERARVLVVLLDLGAPAVGGETPELQLRVLLSELASYRPELLQRPRVVVGSKADVAADDEALCDLVLSAATGTGVGALVERLGPMVQEARADAAAAVAGEVIVHRPVPEGVDVRRAGTSAWVVVGRVAERAVALSDLNDDGAQAEAVRRLRRLGVDRALARAGVRDGDEVTVGAMTFTWGEDGVIAVVKLGSSSVTEETVVRLCGEIVAARRAGHTIVVVTSGAIAAGWGALDRGEQRPADPAVLQAVSAVGQHRLMRMWQDALEPHGTLAGQVLLAPLDFVHRTQYLHARGTLRHLVDLGVVPVVNENDAVADEEIRFGDNDRLAALVAHLIGAQLLVLLTDAPGLLTADPRRDTEASLIEEVVEIDHELERLAGGPGSVAGSGGMASKLAAAKIATWSGVQTLIADAGRPGVLAAALAGEPGVGTAFRPREGRLPARKLWIAFALGASGSLTVDEGARSALTDRGRSLLAAGVTGVAGSFRPEEAVEITGPDGEVFAKGLVRVHADRAAEWMGRRSQVVVHRDDLVLVT